MTEVTRLTRLGKLAEATQAIQQALGRPSLPLPTASAQSTHSDVVENSAAEWMNTAVDTPPAARAPANVEGSRLTGSHSESGLTRDYLLDLPPPGSETPPGAPLPLVVMLHGCTQNPADFALGTGMSALGREQGFAVLYPAQAQDANPQRCWNWFQPDHQLRGQGEAAVLAGMTRAVVAQHGLDARRVYVAGLSAGGAMAANLGQAYPDIYAAVGIHSGLASGAANDLMSALSAMKNGPRTPTSAPVTSHPGAADNGMIGKASQQLPRPTIVFHGDGDGIVHPGNGTHAIAMALGDALDSGDSAAGAAVQELGMSPQGRRYTRTVYRSAGSPTPQAEHWVVHGGGHAWSGGSAQGSYTDPGGPDATREMWRFFSHHIGSAA
ncbi:MAG: poly(3-hydroxyalkanoate) depolymerase [Burkholderiales bacterium PBB1]|nr:MAG: poly(3-hydroxyalkanoate) depolymerase [Burkholderiales bacterium PBB1]